MCVNTDVFYAAIMDEMSSYVLLEPHEMVILGHFDYIYGNYSFH